MTVPGLYKYNSVSTTLLLHLEPTVHLLEESIEADRE